MADIVPLFSDERDTGEPAEPRRFPAAAIPARLLGAAFVCLILFDAAALILGFAFQGSLLSMGPSGALFGRPPPGMRDIVAFGTLPLATRLAYAATLCLDSAPMLMVLRELRGLFRLFAEGGFFATRSSLHLARAAAWLLAGALAPALGRLLVLLAGHGVDNEWLHPSALEALVAAAVLYALSQAMAVGRRNADELGGIV